MTFTLRSAAFSFTNSLILENSESGELLQVLPELGGTVQRLRLDTGSGPADVLTADEPEVLADNMWFRGRLLFPFSDRVKGARYSFNGQDYALCSNSRDDDSAIHGFLYDQKLNVVGQGASDDGVDVTLEFDVRPDAFAGYPFSLHLTVNYALSAQGFRATLCITNAGSVPAPVGFGWHPYFRLGASAAAASNAEPREGHRLQLASERYVEVDESLFPTGQVCAALGTPFDFRSGVPFGNAPIDVALQAAKDGVTKLERGAEGLVLTQDTAFFKYVQLFVPADRSALAIEPVSAATDAWNRPELGRTVLAPHEKVTSWFTVEGYGASRRRRR